MKLITQISRILVGVLFIFSGMVKTIDPIGFGIKLEEYFEVFNMDFLMPYALGFSVFFVIFEVILGVLLLLGVWRKFTLLSLLGLIVFFSFLTFYSAYFNVVTDCGCFGDAIKLKPWESFYKDLILLVLCTVLWIGRKYIQPIFAHKFSRMVSIVSLIVCIWVAYQGIFHLPLQDFRAYAVGNNIEEGMKTAEELGLEPTQIEMTYFLKNKLNGKEIKLSEKEYLGDKSYWEKGSAWEQTATEERVVKEGYEAPIHDFTIECGEEGDKTFEYLASPQLVMILIPEVEKAKQSDLNKVSQLIDDLKKNEVDVVIMANNEILLNGNNSCLTDYKTLKTMIRANPGIMLLKEGTIKAKFHVNDLPNAKEITQLFD